jgi:hypothetical protein
VPHREHDDEDAYWRENYRSSSYVDPGREYEYYQPAYRFGWESFSQYGRRSFEEVDETLQLEWERRRPPECPPWPEARAAARDAWDRAAGRRGNGGS